MRTRDIDRAEQVTAELREAIQEAHGVLKDLRLLKKDISTIVTTQCGDMVSTAAKGEMDRLGDATERAIRQAVDKVTAQFDGLMGILMGKTRGTEPTLTEIARVRAWASERR